MEFLCFILLLLNLVATGVSGWILWILSSKGEGDAKYVWFFFSCSDLIRFI